MFVTLYLGRGAGHLPLTPSRKRSRKGHCIRASVPHRVKSHSKALLDKGLKNISEGEELTDFVIRDNHSCW